MGLIVTMADVTTWYAMKREQSSLVYFEGEPFSYSLAVANVDPHTELGRVKRVLNALADRGCIVMVHRHIPVSPPFIQYIVQRVPSRYARANRRQERWSYNLSGAGYDPDEHQGMIRLTKGNDNDSDGANFAESAGTDQ